MATKRSKKYNADLLVGFEGLATAILKQASVDYRLAKFNYYPDSDYLINDCERFFQSDWYGTLTTVDPEEFKRRSIGKICTEFISINDIIYAKVGKRLLVSIKDIITLAPSNIKVGGSMYSRIGPKWKAEAEEYVVASKDGQLSRMQLWDINTAITFLRNAQFYKNRPNAAAIEKEIKKSAKLARKILKMGADSQC